MYKKYPGVWHIYTYICIYINTLTFIVWHIYTYICTFIVHIYIFIYGNIIRKAIILCNDYTNNKKIIIKDHKYVRT